MNGINWRNSLVAVFLVLAVATTGCMGRGEKVMTVDGTAIYKRDYDNTWKQVLKAMSIEETPEIKKNAFVQELLKQQTLRKLALKVILENDAKKLGVAVSDKELKDFRKEQAEPVGGEEGLKRLLKENDMTDSELSDVLKEQLMMKKLLDKRAGGLVKVSDAEAAKYYNAHIKDFDLPDRIKTSHILFMTNDQALQRDIREDRPNIKDDALAAEMKKQKAAKFEKAKEVLAQVKADPGKFEALAKKHSDDVTSGVRGGDLDYLQQETTAAPFWVAAQKTPAKQIHPELVQTVFGYHIIRVDEHSKAHREPLAKAKPAIVNALLNNKRQELQQQWINEKGAVVQTIKYEPKFRPRTPDEMQQAAQGMPQQPAGG